MKSVIVGARELKTRLGHYLNRVRGGERILVTDRGEPIAELVPLGTTKSEAEVALRKLAAAGGITLPSGEPVVRFRPIGPNDSGDAVGSSAISADRDERG